LGTLDRVGGLDYPNDSRRKTSESLRILGLHLVVFSYVLSNHPLDKHRVKSRLALADK
jgi:hypothetical protein